MLAIFAAAFIYIAINNAKTIFSPSTKQGDSNYVCFGDKCFKVELAISEVEKEQGLMARESLDENKGMLFVFNKEGIYSFWMKYTLIPLDMIWINSRGKVVFIKENAQPCKGLVCPQISPKEKAKYILEINGGICRKLGIKIGDQAKLNIY